MPSAVPGGVYTPAHLRLSMALGEMTNAKGMGAVERFMHHQVRRLVVLTLSNLMYCLKATAWASSVRCRALMRTWDIIIYVLPIQRASSSQTPFQILLSQKWKQKMIAKPGKLSGICCSDQPFPTQQEKESQRGRAAEITHSTIYCPKTTSSTKGTTVIIGVKIHSLLTCERDLQHGFLPSKRALGSQERWAHQLWAASRGAVCRLEGHLTQTGVLSPAQPQHFKNASQ